MALTERDLMRQPPCCTAQYEATLRGGQRGLFWCDRHQRYHTIAKPYFRPIAMNFVARGVLQ